MRASERRRRTREPRRGRLLLLWQDEDGVERISPAECLDVSSHGLRLRVADKLPPHALLAFNNFELGLAGRGTVRYCVPKSGRYEIGVECPNGTSELCAASGSIPPHVQKPC